MSLPALQKLFSYLEAGQEKNETISFLLHVFHLRYNQLISVCMWEEENCDVVQL